MNTELQDYLNRIDCPTTPLITTYNFDVEGLDFIALGITNQLDFESALGVTCGDFAITSTRIQAEILTNPSQELDLRYFSLTAVNYISLADLQGLYLANNQLTTFNPTKPLANTLQLLLLSNNQIATFNPTLALPNSLNALNLDNNQIATFNPTLALPSSLNKLSLLNNQITNFNTTLALPSSLNELKLGGNQLVDFNPTIPMPVSLKILDFTFNQMTTAGYTISETWATTQPSFTSICDIYFTGNPDLVTGTNLETILVSKNTAVTA